MAMFAFIPTSAHPSSAAVVFPSLEACEGFWSLQQDRCPEGISVCVNCHLQRAVAELMLLEECCHEIHLKATALWHRKCYWWEVC